VALLEAELVATRTRQRAVENRWIPKLEEELRIIRSRLEEQELEETLRVHWAAENNERQRGRPVTTSVQEERGAR
ncbi:MAG: V-type ATP synthase subunit D, partial [Nocardioides sp.]